MRERDRDRRTNLHTHTHTPNRTRIDMCNVRILPIYVWKISIYYKKRVREKSIPLLLYICVYVCVYMWHSTVVDRFCRHCVLSRTFGSLFVVAYYRGMVRMYTHRRYKYCTSLCARRVCWRTRKGHVSHRQQYHCDTYAHTHIHI